MKHSCPWAETAEIGVIPERVPVVRTTEVLPRGAQCGATVAVRTDPASSPE
jgi:hypothetical protein